MSIEYLPQHVGIIMDGNRRWAKGLGITRTRGHFLGIQNIIHIIDAAIKAHIPVLSIYAFSTENWNRSKKEVTILMNLMHYFLKQQINWLDSQGVQVRVIGYLPQLPEKVQKIIDYSHQKTCLNHQIILNIAFNYGGRQEILNAMEKMVLAEKRENWSTQSLQSYLYTADLPDIDLLIRTSGEQRISNFMLWQASNAYFYSTNVCWPDFREPQLLEALQTFSDHTDKVMGECAV